MRICLNYINYSNFFGLAGFKCFISNRDHNYADKKNIVSFTDYLGLKSKNLVFPQQIHSKKIEIVNEPCTLKNTDGVISDNKNLVLSILVADCIPLFLLNTVTKTFGLIHSGWRGTKLKIGSNALQLIANGVPNNVKAVIGPSIGQCCFEVGPEVASEFDFRRSNEGVGDRYMLDLKSILRDQLLMEGLESKNIFVDKNCTFCESLRFFSYRREGDKAGRMVAVSAWDHTSF